MTNKTAFETLSSVSTKLKEVTYNSNWSNGTGYLDHAVRGEHAPVLSAGDMVQTMDDYGRLIVICGTAAGNVVVFKRFKGDDRSHIVVANGPRRLFSLLGIDGSLTPSNIELLLGDGFTPNVGLALDDLLEVISKK